MLTYADAARLLGGGRSPVVTALDKLTSGALLGAVVAAPAVLALFDAKTEFIRLSHELIGKLTERRAGLSRYGRTERLAAAHRVVVVSAFFEALAAADLPFRFEDLELTGREQAAIAGVRRTDQSLLGSLFAEGVPTPSPQQPYEQFHAALNGYFTEVAEGLKAFVAGLAAWERLENSRRAAFRAVLRTLPFRALDRYQELFGRLAADFPEVGFWAGLREHAGTRAEVREVATALADLERLLRDASFGRIPDERRSGLAKAYAAELDRSVVESGDVPTGIRVPTLGVGYVPPLCRVAELGLAARPSEESWWSDQPVRDDLSEFLTGYLTNPRAVEAPLLVLGQPGSGKSVLTRVLAARLPAADFLPVRVVLRDVPAAADLQEQVEYAVRAATGERLDWPALARSAGDALPVVLLDGFDELLQATGVSQTDYLVKVAAFQRREADQGRPVVVVVTSRTSVADRARPPEGTIALRLEPFDEARVAAWLANWNAVNADEFAARGVTPLDLTTVLAHRELAEQPLLLLMLALYDADGNALRSAGELRQDQLYERLLRRFARREVVKHRPGLPERELDRAVDEELRRLSVVAFAMFNRNAQWVTEPQLEADLGALFGPPPAPGTADLRAPLRHAEIVLGRFFFVHRARALRDDDPLETYEFLHATFGEFLVARLTGQVLTDIAAREAATTMSLVGGPTDDDLLHALLSYAALSGRAPILGFMRGLMAGVDDERREDLIDLLVRLFQAVHHSRPARRFDSYQPHGLPVPARHAAYSVNLLLLAICAAGTLYGSRLYPGRNVVPCWHRETLLWQSQLSSQDWSSLVETLGLDRLWGDDGSREIALYLVPDPTEVTIPAVDPHWTYDITPVPRQTGPHLIRDSHSFGELARRAHLQCAIEGDVLIHALEPAATVPRGINEFVAVSPSQAASVVRQLVTFLMPPKEARTVAQRHHDYQRFVHTLARLRDPMAERWFVELLLSRLASNLELPAAMSVDIIESLDPRLLLEGRTADRLMRCGLAFLGRDQVVDRRLGALIAMHLRPCYSEGDERLAAEALVRLVETGSASEVNALLTPPEVEGILSGRPDLRLRYERALGHAPSHSEARRPE
ncbi:NACHT domain-containing protein [Plantactinospora solaniradicis]|uniref:NACHT domain-containing protein n=1 Tax=Plantactinospora solaniradicis TaxID=1723736 RepID=A0ABW1KFV8_9ACTN